MNNTFEPELHDIALEAFRGLFRAPITKITVSPNGRAMRIGQNLPDRMAAQLWLEAIRVISANRLPLVAEVKEWEAGEVIFDRFLLIEFSEVESRMQRHLNDSTCY